MPESASPQLSPVEASVEFLKEGISQGRFPARIIADSESVLLDLLETCESPELKCGMMSYLEAHRVVRREIGI